MLMIATNYEKNTTVEMVSPDRSGILFLSTMRRKEQLNAQKR